MVNIVPPFRRWHLSAKVTYFYIFTASAMTFALMTQITPEMVKIIYIRNYYDGNSSRKSSFKNDNRDHVKFWHRRRWPCQRRTETSAMTTKKTTYSPFFPLTRSSRWRNDDDYNGGREESRSISGDSGFAQTLNPFTEKKNQNGESARVWNRGGSIGPRPARTTGQRRQMG